MREYQRKKRAEKSGKVYNVNPEGLQTVDKGLQVEPVNPVCKPDVNLICLKCKPEHERGLQEGYIKGLEEGKKQAYKDMPKPEIVAPDAHGEAGFLPDPSNIPKQRPSYACDFFNPQPKASKPDKPGRHVPPATRPPSKDLSPIADMIAGIDKTPGVAHHPSCRCAVCCPIVPPKVTGLLNKSSNKAFFSPKPQAIPTQPDL
jgi:hypothetical protein